jgi:CelD/BcsL family acetyltransferase involved in cellulose biosynthesis
MTDSIDLAAWTQLFDRCPWAPPFLHPAWQWTWWEVFGGAPLHPIQVHDGFALCFEWENRLVFAGNGITDQLDLLAADDDAARAITDELSHHGLDLQELPATSPLLTAFPHEPCSVSPVVDLRQPPPKNIRRNMKVARRDLDKTGRVEIAHTTRPDYLDDLFRLHAARWQADGETGVLADPNVERFHRLAAPRLAEAGLLRMTALSLDGRVVGVVYGLQRGTRFYSYLGGYEPSLRGFSPGALAIEAAMARAREEAGTHFDFLRGAETYKYAWGAQDRPQYRVLT